MGGSGPQLAQRLRKYTTGTFAGIFSQQSNVEIENPMVVFNIRDLEDELRPVAMFIVLNYIWNKTKSDQRRRILIVDEAWQLMKYDDSANFMFSLAKRARKYNLGITTISQDVEDFISSKMGRAIVANSSMQLLLKQSPSAVDVLADVFKLTSEERNRLSQFPVGQGLFFAGQNHVHIQTMPSPTEAGIISTTPTTGDMMSEQQGQITMNRPAPISQPPIDSVVNATPIEPPQIIAEPSPQPPTPPPVITNSVPESQPSQEQEIRFH